MGDVLPFPARASIRPRDTAASAFPARVEVLPTEFIWPYERQRQEADRRERAQRKRVDGMEAPAALVVAIYAALPPEVREQVRQSLSLGVLAALDGYVAALECTELAEVMVKDADTLRCIAAMPIPAGTPPRQVQP